MVTKQNVSEHLSPGVDPEISETTRKMGGHEIAVSPSSLKAGLREKFLALGWLRFSGVPNTYSNKSARTKEAQLMGATDVQYI